MADSFTYDVFLSHNWQDKPRVRKLAERLRDAGLRVCFDEWVIRAGDDIYLAIERGLEAARVQVLCLSPAALGSDWVTLERSTVLFRDPINAGRRFVPLLLADCDLPDTLRRYKYVDFRQEMPEAFEELLATCQKEAEVAALATQPKPKKKPGGRKPRQEKPPEQAEPLAVLERKLEQKGWVKSVAVSPDGTWAATGSGKTVKIWDLETGACRATLKGHTKYVRSVAIMPDGKWILSGSDDCTIRFWDALKAKHQTTLEPLDGPCLSVSPFPDNERVFIGLASPKNIVELWSFSRGSRLWGHHVAGFANCVAINKKSELAISGHDTNIWLWNPETGECLGTLKGHSKNVNSVQIMPDGRFAVSGSEDKTVKIWNLEEGTCVGTLEGHQRGVDSVAISPDGNLIASTGFLDGMVRLWDWRSGACLQVIEGDRIYFTPISVAFIPDGARLIVGTALSAIYVYRLTGVSAASSVEPTFRYVNAKVVLLGEGAVGKTSLAHRLIEDRYVVKDRTHGMNVWPLELPLPPDATLDREALLWDLAGQEDYRLIHRLFLDETALALLLINPQKDDPFAEAGDWLKALDTAGNHEAKGKSERLLIFSQVDVGGMKISDAKIQTFAQENGFSEWLATSAKTGLNCSDGANGGQPSKLKQLIADRIPWYRLPWTATPRLLAKLKESLMKMRDTADIRLLRFSELTQRLEQSLPGERFGESDVRTTVTLLANHGLALPLKFGDLVLLQPELLNGYAGAIIRAARAHVDEIGCVLEADIYDPSFDFTGVDRLARSDEELLMRAMVQTFPRGSVFIYPMVA